VHDYDPNWDYEAVELDAVQSLPAGAREKVRVAEDKIRAELAPALGFSAGMEVFFVQAGGLTCGQSLLTALGVYCNGTSSRPVIGIDPASLLEHCEAEWFDFGEQVLLTLAHELAHAYQETLGIVHDGETDAGVEDDAEAFARQWVQAGIVDVTRLQHRAPRSNAHSPVERQT